MDPNDLWARTPSGGPETSTYFSYDHPLRIRPASETAPIPPVVDLDALREKHLNALRESLCAAQDAQDYVAAGRIKREIELVKRLDGSAILSYKPFTDEEAVG